VPSARRITAWIMRPGNKLTDDDRTNLADARSRCPDLDPWPARPAGSPHWFATKAADSTSMPG
jgi:hypothetical protein